MLLSKVMFFFPLFRPSSEIQKGWGLWGWSEISIFMRNPLSATKPGSFPIGVGKNIHTLVKPTGVGEGVEETRAVQ